MLGSNYSLSFLLFSDDVVHQVTSGGREDRGHDQGREKETEEGESQGAEVDHGETRRL